MMPAKRLNAAKFSLNNGRDKSGSYNHSTAQYDILRLDPVGNDTSTDYTKDRIVYSLSDNTLTLTAPTFIETVTAGTSANSNKVYAYFYGGADGEYAAWPGETNPYYKYYDKVHNRVYFTVGKNNTKDNVLQLTCEDEMAPAYLRLPDLYLQDQANACLQRYLLRKGQGINAAIQLTTPLLYRWGFIAIDHFIYTAASKPLGAAF